MEIQQEDLVMQFELTLVSYGEANELGTIVSFKKEKMIANIVEVLYFEPGRKTMTQGYIWDIYADEKITSNHTFLSPTEAWINLSKIIERDFEYDYIEDDKVITFN
jgi:hypothetical protein